MKLIAKISLLAVLIISTAVNAYVLIGWSWQYNNIVFHTGFNSGEDGTSAASYQSALNNAINSWNSKSNFQYEINSAYIDPCATGDDNSVSFESDICGTAFGSGVLAVAHTSYYSNSGNTLYSDIIFNSAKNWSIHNNTGFFSEIFDPYDFQRVALHEVGHTLGLDHESTNYPIMYPSYQNSVTTLQTDDINGIRAIYGFGNPTDDYADDTSAATAINFATDVSGSIEVGGDDDYFRISVPAGGGDLDIYSTGSTDTYGYLLDSSGSIIAENNDSGTDSNFKITRTLSVGTYYIRVRGNYFATTGTYTVRANIAIQTPAAPIATVQSIDQINLLWTSVNSATYYRLYNDNTQIYAGANLSYNNIGLVSNTTYTYTLQACINSNIDTCSAQSAASIATTQAIILRIFVIGDNSGVIRGAIIADGINCGTNNDDCSQTYVQNTQVQLTANANSNYSFGGWSSDCSGTDNPLTVIMDSSKLCSASFAFMADTEPNQFTFTSQADVAINTTITSNPAIISGINTATTTVISNGEYSINGGTFSSNNGMVSNGNIVSVRHTSSSNYSSNKSSTLTIGSISANFVSSTQAIPTYTLTTSATNGNISANGISCGTDCTETYNENTSIALTATADNGYDFSSWSGDCSGTDNPLTINIDSDKSCSANFIISAPNIAFSPATITAVVGTNIDITATNDGGTATYSISPALSEGLSFATNTGTISGTPSATATLQIYTITASNITNSDSATLSITVNIEVPNISLSTTTITATARSAISNITVTNSGGDATYSISPAIDNALSFDTTDGTISGTPANAATNVVWTITASNISGNSTATVNITVNPAAPDISLSTTTVVASVATAITAITVSNDGGTATYSISPALSEGLSFATNTGTISGTPSITATLQVYTITASNVTNSDSATLSITVNPAAITFSLDIDGNGSLSSSNDGLIIFKYLLNPNSNNLHTTIAGDVIESRKTTAQLKAYLDDAMTILDIDGNGSLSSSNDGLVIFKYLLNPNSNNLHTTIAGDVIDGRKTTTELKAYLDKYK